MRASRYIAAASVVQQLASAVTLFLVTRNLGAGGYGKLSALSAIANSAVGLGAAGLSVYLLQDGTRRTIEQQPLGRIFPTTMAIGIAVSIAILIGLVLRNAGNIALPGLTIWLVTFALFSGSFGLAYLRYGFQAAEAFRHYSLALAADRCLHCGIISSLKLAGGLTIHSVVASQCLSMAIVALVGMVHLFRHHISLSVRDFSAARFLKSATPNAAQSYLNYFSSSAFLILTLKGMASPEVVGRAALAFRISGLLQTPARWLMPTALAFFMRQASGSLVTPELRQSLKSTVVPIVLWGNVTYAALGVGLIATGLIPAVFGESYDGGDRWVVLVLATTGGEITNSLLVKALWSLGRNRGVFLSNIACGPAVLAAALLSDSYLIIFCVLVVTIWLRSALQLWFLDSLNPAIAVPLLMACCSAIGPALCIVSQQSDPVLTGILGVALICPVAYMLFTDRPALGQPIRMARELIIGPEVPADRS